MWVLCSSALKPAELFRFSAKPCALNTRYWFLNQGRDFISKPAAPGRNILATSFLSHFKSYTIIYKKCLIFYVTKKVYYCATLPSKFRYEKKFCRIELEHYLFFRGLVWSVGDVSCNLCCAVSNDLMCCFLLHAVAVSLESMFRFQRPALKIIAASRD
jgi:hypothetical protein